MLKRMTAACNMAFTVDLILVSLHLTCMFEEHLYNVVVVKIKGFIFLLCMAEN